MIGLDKLKPNWKLRLSKRFFSSLAPFLTSKEWSKFYKIIHKF